MHNKIKTILIIFFANSLINVKANTSFTNNSSNQVTITCKDILNQNMEDRMVLKPKEGEHHFSYDFIQNDQRVILEIKITGLSLLFRIKTADIFEYSIKMITINQDNSISFENNTRNRIPIPLETAKIPGLEENTQKVPSIKHRKCCTIL